MGNTVAPSGKSFYPLIISIANWIDSPLYLTWMSHHQLPVAILSQHWSVPLSFIYKRHGAYIMYCSNSGLPINSWIQSTGFQHHSSTISLWVTPPSSTMSSSTSRSSHVHFSPDGRASIFLRRDCVLWNEAQPLSRICDALISPVLCNNLFTNLLHFQKLICGSLSHFQLNYPFPEILIAFIQEHPPYRFPLGDLSITQRFKHGEFSA